MLTTTLIVVVHFLVGAVASCILHFLWDFHRLSKMLVTVACAATVVIVLSDVGGFAASFSAWYFELSQFLGIVIGPKIANWI